MIAGSGRVHPASGRGWNLPARVRYAGAVDAASTQTGVTPAQRTGTPSPVPPRRWPETFRSLANREYRLFWSAMLVSNVGTWMQRVAQDWLVLVVLKAGGTALGITTGLQFLPFLILSPAAGILADRLPKRRLLIATNAVMGLLAVVLGGLVLTGAARVWHVYVLALLLGVASALDNPARQAWVSEIVGPDDVPNAVGLNSVSFNGARIVGPGVAGLLIAAMGTGPVFMLNALTFAAPVLALLASREPPPPDPGRARQVADGLRAGLCYVRARRDLVAVLVTVFGVGTFGMNFQMTNALVSSQVFHRGVAEYGLLGSIMAVGSLTGSLLAARRGRTRPGFVLAAAAVFAVVEIGLALMPTWWSYALALVPVGVAALTVITAANTYVQTSVVPEVRGRVLSLYLMLFMGGGPIGAPTVGWIAETFGARWSLAGGGLLALLFTGAAALVLRSSLAPIPSGATSGEASP